MNYKIGQVFENDYPNEAVQWCNGNNAFILQSGTKFTIVSIPPHTLDELKAQKLELIDAWTAAKITGGFISECSGTPVRYDSDKDTQLTMQGIALNVGTPLFAEKYPDGCPVRGVAEGKDSKAVYLLNPQQVMQWMADLSIHIGDCKQAGWKKQAEVESCKTVFELNNIEL